MVGSLHPPMFTMAYTQTQPCSCLSRVAWQGLLRFVNMWRRATMITYVHWVKDHNADQRVMQVSRLLEPPVHHTALAPEPLLALLWELHWPLSWLWPFCFGVRREAEALRGTSAAAAACHPADQRMLKMSLPAHWDIGQVVKWMRQVKQVTFLLLLLLPWSVACCQVQNLQGRLIQPS